ncbi:pyrroline-5-carboxylate reductase [Oceanicoccus sp. KOV_DT_Chl]|uniref:pyrroline-5-carboxylate reductase n=1 Tax=Oceanicoccus sp. KOV_DT_Chl TaxID=1904639 RepID=UPI002101B1DD|nr:pyrroline-5-carboxylate reductase [Oceanicoccus sp. KOV_DT_Chl]
MSTVSSDTPHSNITFIGAGNMAASIIGGLVNKGFAPHSITASDPYPQSLSNLREVAAVNITDDNHQAIANADVVVLAVKPQVMKPILQDLASSAQQSKPLIISIAAGIEIHSLNKWLGGNMAIVRCMPNTPSLVQTGATALFANDLVTEQQRQAADSILRAVGIALWVDQESQLDAVTAVSGSGPAYFFLLMEAMQAAGEQLGLSADVAKQLTLQTALGAAQMAISSDVDAAELRRRVTSPGGTTEQAIKVFEDQGMRDIVNQALIACRDRSEELAKLLDE